MSQFITIQVGQCGNEIGSVFWPRVLHEYGINTSNDSVNLFKPDKNYCYNSNELSDEFNSFFYIPESKEKHVLKSLSDLESSNVKARAILIDTEDSIISKCKKSSLHKLFDQSCMVTNNLGSGNNWAIGYYTHGLEFQDLIEETVRQVAEKCDCLHGFLMMHSLGGGTGSGLGTATLKLIHDAYPHVDRFQSKAKFTSWSKDSMKIGLCMIPPVGQSASVLGLVNSTAMSKLFKGMVDQFDVVYKKKAHIHHYTQVNQFQVENFIESKEKILEIYNKYLSIEKEKLNTVSRLHLK